MLPPFGSDPLPLLPPPYLGLPAPSAPERGTRRSAALSESGLSALSESGLSTLSESGLSTLSESGLSASSESGLSASSEMLPAEALAGRGLAVAHA